MICPNKPAQKATRKNIYNPLADPSPCSHFPRPRAESSAELFCLCNERLLLETLRYCSFLFSSLQSPGEITNLVSPHLAAELELELNRQEAAIQELLKQLQAGRPDSRQLPFS